MLVDQRARLGATATVRVPIIATTIMSSVIVNPLCCIRASSSLALLLRCQSSCQSPRSARTSLHILTRDELPNVAMLYAFTSPDFCAEMVYTLCHHDPAQRGSGTYIRARKTSRRGTHGFYRAAAA